MNPIIQTYTVDFASNNNFLFIKGVQGDGHSTRYADISLMNDGQPYELSADEVTAIIKGKKPDNAYIFNKCEILDSNTIRVEITQQMAAIAGKSDYEISILSNEENMLLTSFPFFIVISPSSFDASYITSTDEFSLLVKKINEVNTLKKENEELKAGMEEATENCEDATEKAKDATNTCIEQTNVCKDATDNANNIANEIDQLSKDISAEESIRIANEIERKNNENIRIDNENARISEWNDIKEEATAVTDSANSAANSANDAADAANAIKNDLQNKLDSGYFKGDKGDKGDTGEKGDKGDKGNDGVVFQIKDMFAFQIKGDDLYLVYDDNNTPPNMYINSDGHLIYNIS